MTRLNLEVLTPSRAMLKATVDRVTLEGGLGQLGILPGHAPLISTTELGPLTYVSGSETQTLLCGKGFLEVRDDQVSVLVRSAERMEDLDRERAQRALDRAQERIRSSRSDVDLPRAREAEARAQARLRFIKSR